MPIGDLLAQISGGKSSDTAVSVPHRSNAVPAKRKAGEDLPSTISKAPRLYPSSSNPTNGISNGSFNKPNSSFLSSKTASNGNRISKPSPIMRKPTPSNDVSSKPRAPPKKGSYAEILARGQRAQAVMGQVGRLQHKKVEKGAVRKAPEEAKVAPSSTQGKRPMGYKGTSKPVPRNGAVKEPLSKTSRPNTGARSRPGPTKKAAEVEVEKKIKKAASATTGYTGTARPKPGNPSKSSNGPRGGALLNTPIPRGGASKGSRHDDYDEELDDFIEYDDEEDDGGPRYYDSDGSSDMEAGLDDIDHEERRAEYIARREDVEEERLEKSLKVAKEEKKRKALEALRNKRR